MSVDLKKRIKQAGLTHTEFARRMGVNKCTISMWIKNGRIPNLEKEKRARRILAGARSEQPTKTILRKKKKVVRAKAIVSTTENQAFDGKVTLSQSHLDFERNRNYVKGYREALYLTRAILETPTNETTKLELVTKLSQASVSFSPSKQ